jgi:hypothetical protein
VIEIERGDMGDSYLGITLGQGPDRL